MWLVISNWQVNSPSIGHSSNDFQHDFQAATDRNALIISMCFAWSEFALSLTQEYTIHCHQSKDLADSALLASKTQKSKAHFGRDLCQDHWKGKTEAGELWEWKPRCQHLGLLQIFWHRAARTVKNRWRGVCFFTSDSWERERELWPRKRLTLSSPYVMRWK